MNELFEATDALLAFVDEHAERIHCGEEYATFLRLDARVYIAARRANLLDTLPAAGDDTVGKTRLPVLWLLDGAVPRTFTWKVDMLTLRTLAEAGHAPEPDDQWITLSEAARKLGLTPVGKKRRRVNTVAVQRLVAEGALRDNRKSGQARRVSQRSIHDYLEQGKRPAR